MNPSFPVFHPCEIEYVYNASIGDRVPVHHIGKVDDEQVICPNCLMSFTHWIDLWKSHHCSTGTQNSCTESQS